MIKIIKPGKIKKAKKYIYKMTCPHCGCIFEFEAKDLLSEKRLNGKRSIICPTCDKELLLIDGQFGEKDNYEMLEVKE